MFTDQGRAKSIFDLKPNLLNDFKQSIKDQGSSLSFVKSNCSWTLENSKNTEEYIFFLKYSHIANQLYLSSLLKDCI